MAKFGYSMDIVLLVFISALQMCPSQTISTNHVRSISPRDYYRNNPLPPDKINWEIGLKEATYQALIREQIPDPDLKSGIYSANIDGFQDIATPFGDIALIARGQLYATNQGYQFIQDPYQNDCDDCHSTGVRCDRRQCDNILNPNIDNLLALWTVKRIRHRDSKYGHRYELQFTISPMGPTANPHFVARTGKFDYNIPGHVFIVKLKENASGVPIQNHKNSFRFDKEHRGSNHKELKIVPWTTTQQQTVYQHHNTPNSIVLNTGEYFLQKEKAATAAATTEHHVFNPGFLIGISPNGYKHVIHDLPGLVAERPPYYDSQPRQYIPPPPPPVTTTQETTTKEPIKHYHHHFYIPEVEDIDLDKKVTTTIKNQPQYHQTATTYKTEKHPTYIVTTSENIPKTVYTQEIAQSQVTSPVTTTINGYNNIRTTYNRFQDTTIPITNIPTYYHTEPPQTTLFKFFTAPTQTTPFNPSPFYIQYSEPDPLYNNNQPPTIPTFVSTIQPTIPTFITIPDHLEQTDHSIFDEITHAQATTPNPTTTTATTIPKINTKLKYPDSINAQLPPPDKGTDTTVPYVASTAVTIISTPSSKITTVTEASRETETQEEHSAERETESSDRKTTIQESTTDSSPITITRKYDVKDNNEDSQLFEVVHIPKRKPKPPKNTEDIEIFGESKSTPSPQTTKSTEPTASTKKRPNAFDEIFGDFKSSTENTFGDFKSSTENSNKFLTPHTQLSINNTDALRNARISKYLKYKRNKTNRFNKYSNRNNKTESTTTNQQPVQKTTDLDETKTSQSFITSISFKVNKNNETNENISTVPNTNEQELTKNDSGFNIYEIQRPVTSTDRTQTFDDIAQTLVNHARIVSYLDSKAARPTRRSGSYKTSQSQ